MKTRNLTADEMAERVARYEGLTPIAVQLEKKHQQEILDLIYARQLLPVVGLEKDRRSAISNSAPIVGAGGMTITYAVCPQGQGPGLHAHKDTYETFTVMRGRFAFLWGDEGDQSVVLDEFDVISVPPRVNRAFRNVGDREGVLQVVITGGVHDHNDIDLSPQVGEAIDRIDPEARKIIEKEMFTFTAGKDQDEAESA